MQAIKHPTRCLIEGCGGLAKFQGLCSRHFEKHQCRPAGPRRRTGPRTYKVGGSFMMGGYRHLYVEPDFPGARPVPTKRKVAWAIPEHYLVMQKALGRPITSGERVRHRNRKRDDNRIENLELLVSARPKSSRLSDVLAWSREMIALYADAQNIGIQISEKASLSVE